MRMNIPWRGSIYHERQGLRKNLPLVAAFDRVGLKRAPAVRIERDDFGGNLGRDEFLTVTKTEQDSAEQQKTREQMRA